MSIIDRRRTARTARKLTVSLGSFICMVALCMAPLGLAACSNGSPSGTQASTSANTEAAATDPAEESQAVYLLTKASSTNSSMQINETDVFTRDASGNCTALSLDQTGPDEQYNFHQDITSEYDLQGAPTSQSVDGTASSYNPSYDEAGHLISTTVAYDEYTVTWEYTYNEDGSLASAAMRDASADGSYSYTTIWKFNANGWVSEISYDGAQGTDVTNSTAIYTYEGDPAMPASATVTYTYADEGVDPEPITYNLSYDENGNLVASEPASEDNGSSWSFEYEKIDSPSTVAAAIAALKAPFGYIMLF